jgi:hypothetical protein
MSAVHSVVVRATVLVALGACGDKDPDQGDDTSGRGRGRDSGAPHDADAGPSAGGSFFPFAVGNRWTFRVTEDGAVTTKTQTIGALEPVGGTGPNKDTRAYRATTSKGDGKGDGGDETVSWQAEVDGKIVRYREQSFSATGELELEEHWAPYKLRVDSSQARLMAGAMWTETYSETKQRMGKSPSTDMASDTWRVVAGAESVTVPAGTFTALVIEKTGGTPKRYWFVRGIGKVKETGTQTEELQSYDVTE